MNLDLNNNDFILGVFAAADPDLEVDSVASGSFEHGGGSIGYEWRLISHSSLDARVLVLANSEDGIEWKGELSKTTPLAITEALVAPFRQGEMGGLSTLACVLTNGEAAVNPKFVSKRLIVRAISEGCAILGEPFDAKLWATRVGFK